VATTSTTSEELRAPSGDEVAAPPPSDGQGAVQARGYWEQVWRRFKRDRVALVSIGFLVLLLMAVYPGAWIA
jgi:hypothetical protein